MGSNPLNLTFRFLLEFAALAAMAYWGSTQHDGVMRIVAAVGAPLLAAVVWGTFVVPNDPSRSGRARVPIPGFLRLTLELMTFGFAVWCLFESGQTTIALIFGLLVLFHYLISYDRIAWLVRQ